MRASIGLAALALAGPAAAVFTAELVERDFINTACPHPTLSEMTHESVLAAYGRALHT